MAYATTNPPIRMSEYPLTSFGGSPNPGGALWRYMSTDAIGTVQAAGYFTDGQSRGMQKGDIVYVHVTNAAPYAVYICIVTSLSAVNNSVTLSNTTTTTIN